MPSAPENTSCWKSFPSPVEGKSMTDLWSCKSADLSFLHGRPHRVTATVAASHYRDPRSTSRKRRPHVEIYHCESLLSCLAVCWKWQVKQLSLYCNAVPVSDVAPRKTYEL
ncbi:hypothetical protein Q8A67_019244 [Cirrhinus molitorella]|uniref:Uncharacterized protein n=1 Tax=Cirrhinus molitorella TaxID=172907 RepID=A0AA88PAD3_9TELE|nr:hypothetical protein Q8A67_019244 [Cirrhinus molitorella]